MADLDTNRLAANAVLTEAVRRANMMQNDATFQAMMDAVADSVRNEAIVVVPLEGPIAADGVTIRTMQTEDGNEWIPCFTDEAQLTDDMANMELMTMPFGFIVEQAANADELAGLVINPFTTPAPIHRGLAQEVLNYLGNPRSVQVVIGDITQVQADAIVNAANPSLMGGGGVDGAIHAAAGAKLKEACAKLGGCAVGEAKITDGYDLPARYVIHTVGPVYSGRPEDAEQLANCYRNSLKLAMENDIHSIAFPCISTGAYGYPAQEAAEIQLRTITQVLADNDYPITVMIVCFSEETAQIFKALQEGRG